MRTVAHLSDLHFGRVDYAIAGGLIAKLFELRPDLVVVSGDLTQRAKGREFREAKAFLDRLPRPQLVVPGNHDVPLYNIMARWLTPLDLFRRYICEELEPLFVDAEIAVVGINSARSNTLKSGRINQAQVERACRKLNESGVRKNKYCGGSSSIPFTGGWRSGESHSPRPNGHGGICSR